MAGKTSVKATTQDFTQIDDILDGIVILRDASAALVIETSAVNFGLLSEDEQDALIFAYSSLLNSLSFPLQVLIIMERMDISSYISFINQQSDNQPNKRFKEYIKLYKEFIMSIVKDNKVLEKRFFVVIPFSPLELGIKSAAGGFSTNKKKLPFSKTYILQRAKTSLYPKRDHLIRQLSKLGLKGKQLENQQLVELFYNLYNPTITGEKLDDVQGYTQPVLEGRFKN